MMNGRILLSGVVGFLALAMGLVGCGGDHHCFECGQPNFTGAYEGSGINSSGIFSITLNIDNSYNITGTETQVTGGTGAWTVAGSVDNGGNASITLTPTSGSATVETGSMQFVGSGVIQVAFYAAGSNTPIPVTLGVTNAALWDGNYSGTYAASGGVTGTGSVQIDSSGNVSGTISPSGGGGNSTLSGTIGPNGVATVTVTPTAGSPVTYQGGAAYNTSEELTLTAANGSSTLAMTLTYVSPAVHRAFKVRP